MIQGLLFEFFGWLNHVLDKKVALQSEEDLSWIEYFLTHKCQIL